MRAELNREFCQTEIRKKNERPERLGRVQTISTIRTRQAQPQTSMAMTYCHVLWTKNYLIRGCIDFMSIRVIRVIRVPYLVQFVVHEMMKAWRWDPKKGTVSQKGLECGALHD